MLTTEQFLWIMNVNKQHSKYSMCLNEKQILVSLEWDYIDTYVTIKMVHTQWSAYGTNKIQYQCLEI